MTQTSPAPRQGPGRPAGVDSFDTRQRVVEAACHCFAQHGYGPSTNNLIAEKAGVTAGSVYYHFGTKQNLFAAVCDHVYGKVITLYTEVFSEPKTLAELLGEVLKAFLEINREAPDLAAFLAAAPIDARRHHELFPMYDKHVRLHAAKLTEAITRGQQADLIAADFSPATVEILMRVLVTGFAHTALAYDADEIAAAAAVLAELLQGAPTVA